MCISCTPSIHKCMLLWIFAWSSNWNFFRERVKGYLHGELSVWALEELPGGGRDRRRGLGFGLWRAETRRACFVLVCAVSERSGREIFCERRGPRKLGRDVMLEVGTL